MTAQMSCLFNTPELSPYSPHPFFFLSWISALQIPSCTPPPSTPQLLLSCFYLPLSIGSHCVWRAGGEGEKKRGREVEGEWVRKGSRESGRPLAVRESAPGWAGFLDTLWGAIVLHVSSPSLLMGPVYHRSDYGRWLGLGGGRGGDGRSRRIVHVCVRERESERDTHRKKEYLEGRWDEGKVWGQGLKNAGTPKSPIDWNPST